MNLFRVQKVKDQSKCFGLFSAERGLTLSLSVCVVICLIFVMHAQIAKYGRPCIGLPRLRKRLTPARTAEIDQETAWSGAEWSEVERSGVTDAADTHYTIMHINHWPPILPAWYNLTINTNHVPFDPRPLKPQRSKRLHNFTHYSALFV